MCLHYPARPMTLNLIEKSALLFIYRCLNILDYSANKTVCLPHHRHYSEASIAQHSGVHNKFYHRTRNTLGLLVVRLKLNLEKDLVMHTLLKSSVIYFKKSSELTTCCTLEALRMP